MTGRKPVPRALKLARGNPGQHKISDDEPEPSSDIDLGVPAALAGDADASAEWNDKAPMLHRLGLLTEVDRDALVMYCATFARWKYAERELREHGLVLTRKRKGGTYLLLSPYLSIASKAQEQCRALLLEFGLTPVSRNRVHVKKRQAVDAKQERFFGAGPTRIKPA